MTHFCFQLTRRERRTLGFWIRRIARCVFAGKNDDLGKGVTPVASPGEPRERVLVMKSV